MSQQVEVNRTRRARCSFSKGLAQQVGQLCRCDNFDVVFGDRRKEGGMPHFLISITVLRQGRLFPGEGHHRREPQIRVLEPGRQIGCSYRLRHTDPGLVGNAGIAIGHVSRGFFRVREDAADSQSFQLHHRFPQHIVHIKDVCHAVSLECFGDESGAGDGMGELHEIIL